MGDPFGPRASIVKVGVCEPLPDGNWMMTGWVFHGRNDPVVLDRGCPYVHDADERHVGYLGWLFTDLQALSAAQMELAMLDTAEPGRF